MESVDKKINDLINPDFGKKQDLTPDDNKFIKEYQDGIGKLSEEERPFYFVNVIRSEGRCGFASGGTYNYLVNTDTRNRYRVTIRTFWQSGINSGQSDRVEIIEAGGRIGLGCTDSGYIPVTYYTRQVVGESRI